MYDSTFRDKLDLFTGEQLTHYNFNLEQELRQRREAEMKILLRRCGAQVADVLNPQIGGSHYSDMEIQPIEYILKNKIGFSEGNVIKYVSRWRSKGGIQDLEKAIHTIQQLIVHEKGKNEALRQL